MKLLLLPVDCCLFKCFCLLLWPWTSVTTLCWSCHCYSFLIMLPLLLLLADCCIMVFPSCSQPQHWCQHCLHCYLMFIVCLIASWLLLRYFSTDVVAFAAMCCFPHAFHLLQLLSLLSQLWSLLGAVLMVKLPPLWLANVVTFAASWLLHFIFPLLLGLLKC